MSHLYNLRTTAKGFYITKFDADLNVMSSYNMIAGNGTMTCECPQGIKPTCRHRKMLPLMQDRADSAWFFNFEQGRWVDPTGQANAPTDILDTMADALGVEDTLAPTPKADTRVGYEAQGTGYDPGARGYELQGRDAAPSPPTSAPLTPPKGVTIVSLADPEALHNTIAKAVGEAPIRRRV